MDEDLRSTLAELTRQVENLHASVDKLLRYLRITMYVTVAIVAMPLVFAFMLPFFLSTLTDSYVGIGM